MLQRKPIDVFISRSMRQFMACSVISSLLIAPLAGHAEENPVTRLQHRSASKRFQQMKSQHQQWESMNKKEHVPESADDWNSASPRTQRRTERQQIRNHKNEESHSTSSNPATPPAAQPVESSVQNHHPSSKSGTGSSSPVHHSPLKKNTPFERFPHETPASEQHSPVMSFPAAENTKGTAKNNAPLEAQAKQETAIPETKDKLLPLVKPEIVVNEQSGDATDQWVPVRTQKKPVVTPKPEVKQNAMFPVDQDGFVAPEKMNSPKSTEEEVREPLPVLKETVFPLFAPFQDSIPVPPAPKVIDPDDKHVTQKLIQKPFMQHVTLTNIQEPKPDNTLNNPLSTTGPKKISEISPYNDYQPTDTIDPNNIEGSKLCELSKNDQSCPPRHIMEPTGNLERNSPHFNKYWYASNVTYNPLYFEDFSLERYGQEHHPVVQPFISVGKFGGQLFGLPYQWVMHPPCEEVSPLGYYSPGEVAPEMIYQVPVNPEAAIATGLVYTGLFFVIP